LRAFSRRQEPPYHHHVNLRHSHAGQIGEQQRQGGAQQQPVVIGGPRGAQVGEELAEVVPGQEQPHERGQTIGPAGSASRPPLTYPPDDKEEEQAGNRKVQDDHAGTRAAPRQHCEDGDHG